MSGPERKATCNAVIAPRGHVRTCKRAATEHLITTAGTCARHFCRQHVAGQARNPAGLWPWEYERVESYTYWVGRTA